MPRLGKIRLGRKVQNKSGQGEHPEATKTFVMPPELFGIFGEECAELPIMIPAEDDELWASQYYKRYSSTRGLTCKGDGVTCRRMLDTATGAIADRNTTEVVWKEGLPCDGVTCPEYTAKPQRCKEVMHLQFIMPDVPGLGIWQIDTSSINSIRNINSSAAMVRSVYKHLAFIPLLLTLEPIEVVNPDDGKKKTVHVLNLRVRGTMRELMIEAARPFNELLLPAPTDVDFTEPIEEDPEPEPAADPVPPAVKPPVIISGKPLYATSADEFDGIPSASQSKVKPPAVVASTEPPAPAPKPPTVVIDMDWLHESLKTLKWNTVIHWLFEHYHVGGEKVSGVVPLLTEAQQREFAKEVEDRLAMK
jgi:hypothetical protein